MLQHRTREGKAKAPSPGLLQFELLRWVHIALEELQLKENVAMEFGQGSSGKIFPMWS